MHSSRMRTCRSLTVCRGCLLSGGCLLPRGMPPSRGFCFWGVASSLRGCLLPGGTSFSGGVVMVVSQHALRQKPLNLQPECYGGALWSTRVRFYVKEMEVPTKTPALNLSRCPEFRKWWVV